MAEAKKVLTLIKRRIQEAGGAGEAVELDLTEVQIGRLTPEMRKAIESCKSLEVLGLAECDLTSLENLPRLDSLLELDVSSNSLKDNDLKAIAACCKNLTSLSIGDNAIACLRSIEHLRVLKDLEMLNCDDTPVANEANYAKVAFETFKKLKYLDCKDKDGKEMAYEDLNTEKEGEVEGEQGQQGEEGEEEEEGAEGMEDEDEEDDADYDDFDEEQQQEQEQQEEPKPKKRSK